MNTNLVDFQKSTAEFPLVFPNEVLHALVKHESDKSFLNVYTKYNHRAKLAVQNLMPVLKDLAGMSRVSTYLDIGCGTGAVSALVAKTLKCDQVYLIDGDGSAHRTTGYTPKGTAWNDVRVAMAMVSANVEANVTVAGLIAPDLDKTFLPDKIGLITSFRSWGHHYYISEYAGLVQKKLMHGGLVVLDIRNGTDGFAKMKHYGFKHMGDIPDQSKKCRRALFTNA